MRTATFLGGVSVLALAGIVACSSSDKDDLGSADDVDGAAQDGGAFERDGSVYDSAASPESGLGELLFRPSLVYSGTDGTHTFKVPVAVYDSDTDLVVTASDPTALTLAPTTLKNPVDPNGVTDNGKYYLVTALAAGTFRLTATSKGKSTTATVTIASYAPGRYAAGEARYQSDVTTGDTRGCKSCHVNGLAIDNSPAALATATDQEIGIIITTGVKPGPSVIVIPGQPTLKHQWNVTPTEKDGLITYLRALDPRGFQ
jgi:hypothetical protein